MPLCVLNEPLLGQWLRRKFQLKIQIESGLPQTLLQTEVHMGITHRHNMLPWAGNKTQYVTIQVSHMSTVSASLIILI